jgi:hypothetical protein
LLDQANKRRFRQIGELRPEFLVGDKPTYDSFDNSL